MPLASSAVLASSAILARLAKRWSFLLLIWLACGPPAQAQTAQAQTVPAQIVLRIFAGPLSRSEIFRELLARYSAGNPAIRVEIAGGDTLAEQRGFLPKALAAREPMLDLVLIDALHPAQWAAARWIEPLDAYLGPERNAILASYLPASLASATIAGKLFALPFMADTQFLFYRKDLLEKYALRPPRDWGELTAGLQTVLGGENQRGLQGFAVPGTAVESATCAFLSTLWGADGELFRQGKPQFDDPALAKTLALWDDLKAAKVVPADLATVATDQVRQDLASGSLVMGLGWGYMWPRFQNEAGSRVAGRIGVAPPPGHSAEAAAGCIGGWHVAVIAASPAKVEAARLARFLSSPEAARALAIGAGALPVFTALYNDPEVLAAQPWFKEALPVLLKARLRPQSPRYAEISEALRVNFHALLAGTRNAEGVIGDLKNRFGVIFR